MKTLSQNTSHSLTGLHYSSRQTPCPVCGRTQDTDCRWCDAWIACHTGAAAHDIKPGETVWADGRQWYLSRVGGGHSVRAHVYRPHRPGQQQRQRRCKPDVKALSLPSACRRFAAVLRPRVHAALRVPLWEHCTPADLQLVIDAFNAAQQLIKRLQDARRDDPALAALLPVARHWLKALGYQRADLARFQRQQLGMLEGWR